MVKTNPDTPKHILGVLVAIIILLFIVSRCNAQSRTTAQIDTMSCNITCIDKFVEEKTSTGKTRYYAVYNDTKNDISELIPVSQTVMSYIRLCESNKIKPSLGIKLRNGQINSLIKYKATYIRRKR